MERREFQSPLLLRILGIKRNRYNKYIQSLVIDFLFVSIPFLVNENKLHGHRLDDIMAITMKVGGDTTIYDKICEERNRLDRDLQKIREKLDNMPEGNISCVKNGKYTKWYISKDGKQTCLSKKKREIAEQLAVKKYLNYLFNDKLSEMMALEQYIQYYELKHTQRSQEFIDKAEYKQLLSNYFTPLSEELNDWMKAPYERNEKYPEHLIHKTNADYAGRSKSEALIDMTLRINKIPFRYECALELDGITLFPDFTIRHPETGEFLYWEHFGMMDTPSYFKNAYDKLQLYASYGIIPTINMIVTIETKDMPLGVDTIEKRINEYLC